jgi:hypothetical protein
LNREFVDGSGSTERLILHRLYFTYILYHNFFIFSMNYLWALFIFFGAPLESRTPDTVIF